VTDNSEAESNSSKYQFLKPKKYEIHQYFFLSF